MESNLWEPIKPAGAVPFDDTFNSWSWCNRKNKCSKEIMRCMYNCMPLKFSPFRHVGRVCRRSIMCASLKVSFSETSRLVKVENLLRQWINSWETSLSPVFAILRVVTVAGRCFISCSTPEQPRAGLKLKSTLISELKGVNSLAITLIHRGFKEHSAMFKQSNTSLQAETEGEVTTLALAHAATLLMEEDILQGDGNALRSRVMARLFVMLRSVITERLGTKDSNTEPVAEPAAWAGVLPMESWASTSAPASNSFFTISECPHIDALCNGVHDSKSFNSKSAPREINKSRQSVWPILAATWRAVCCCESLILKAAPASKSTRRAAEFWFLDAKCKGDSKSAFLDSMSAPKLRNILIASWKPFSEAICKGERCSRSWAWTFAPFSVSSVIMSTLPTDATQCKGVTRSWPVALTSAPLSKRTLTVLKCPFNEA